MGAPAFDRSTLSRALYSSDASLYRVVPQAVYVPADVDDLVRAVDGALAEQLPITIRGAGTSARAWLSTRAGWIASVDSI